MQDVDVCPGGCGVRWDARVVAGVVVRRRLDADPPGELRRTQLATHRNPATISAAFKVGSDRRALYLGNLFENLNILWELCIFMQIVESNEKYLPS